MCNLIYFSRAKINLNLPQLYARIWELLLRTSVHRYKPSLAGGWATWQSKVMMPTCHPPQSATINHSLSSGWCIIHSPLPVSAANCPSNLRLAATGVVGVSWLVFMVSPLHKRSSIMTMFRSDTVNLIAGMHDLVEPFRSIGGVSWYVTNTEPRRWNTHRRSVRTSFTTCVLTGIRNKHSYGGNSVDLFGSTFLHERLTFSSTNNKTNRILVLQKWRVRVMADTFVSHAGHKRISSVGMI